MAILRLPVRWYSNETRYGELDLEVKRTAFMIVDSDCGSGNEYVEKGIAPALAAARGIGMKVVFIHNDFSLVDEPGSIKREIHGTRWGNTEAATLNLPHRPDSFSTRIIPLLYNPYRMSQIFRSESGRVFTRPMWIIISGVTTSRR